MHKKDVFWAVKMESKHRGYLKMSVKNESFDTEKGAWNFVKRMKKKYPECKFYIGQMAPANFQQMSLDLNSNIGPDGLDF